VAADGHARRSTRARLGISKIDPDPRNPRAPTDSDVQTLAASIVHEGLIHPIVVRPTGDRYTIVAGHRRFAAWCRCAADAPSDARWRPLMSSCHRGRRPRRKQGVSAPTRQAGPGGILAQELSA
jgi:hypothetical protein